MADNCPECGRFRNLEKACKACGDPPRDAAGGGQDDEDARYCPDCGNQLEWQPNEKVWICRAGDAPIRFTRTTIEDHHHGRV